MKFTEQKSEKAFAKLSEMKMFVDKPEIKLTPIVFEGGHEINKATLARLVLTRQLPGTD